MWEVPRFRIRAYIRALNQSRQRRFNPPPADLVRFKRTQAQLAVSGGFGTPVEIIPARVVLNDLSPSEIVLFSKVPFEVGQRVSLTMDEPKRFFIQGRVAYCKAFELSPRVISAEKFPYRVKLQFVFGSQQERDAVRAYCNDLSRTILQGNS